ncbi:MAG: serine/threonine-protein kinase, partial [Planctomycetota bacterium]
MPVPDGQRQEILAACMDALERGDQAAVERACREWPDLAPEIHAAAKVMAVLHGARGEPPAAAAARVPEAVGRFRILGELGRGGMGVVYRAHDPALDREVALKVQPGLAASPRAAERFRREARLLAQIRHPHIVAIHDVGETAEGLPYFAMDLVEGKPLGQILSAAAATKLRALRAEHLLPEPPGATNASRGPYLEAAVRLVAKVADGLHHAHQEGITHRDVKPSNILVDREGEPHLVDFGIAREHANPVATSPDTHTGAGTPSYMAPEQIAEDGTIGPWTDVYALGVTLYELITLQRPFAAATNPHVLRRILESEPRSPSKLNPQVTADLETICLTALAKDPRRRYGSARAFADDLARLLAMRPILARPPGLVERAVKFVRRNPWPTAVASVTILAATGGVIARGVLANWDRIRARRHIELANELVMGGAPLENVIDNLERANALLPEEEPGRELIAAIKGNRFAHEVEEIANAELRRCSELRGAGGGGEEIVQRTGRVLRALNELALQAPDAEALNR